jgi:plasmid maintenance system antidote protein VapI
MTTPRGKLIEIINKAGSQAEAARQIGYSRQYIHLIINNKAPISEKLANRLGFNRVSTAKWVER